jgi:uncharacterized Zn finger protein (UPF0148 family)
VAAITLQACPRCHCDTVGADWGAGMVICTTCGWRAPAVAITTTENVATGERHQWHRPVSDDEIYEVFAGTRICDCDICQNRRLHQN